MSADWQITRSTQECAGTGRKLETGETYFSALREEGDTFVRLDYCEEAWGGIEKGQFFSFWKTKVRAPEERKRLVVDVEAFYAFFTSLGEPEQPHRKVFRYLVALLLTRKRVLRLDEIEKNVDGDVLVLYDRRIEGTVRVECPPVTEQQLAEAQEALNQIFECSSVEMEA